MMYKLTPITALLLSLFFACISFAADITITFKDKAIIEGDKILLTDIADVTANGVEENTFNQLTIATAPDPGERISLQTNKIIFFVQQTTSIKDINWSGPAHIEVIRDGITVDKERIQQILATYLSQNLDKLPKAEIRFASMRFPKPFILPKGNLTWEIIPSRPEIIGSSSFSIIFRLNGKTVKNTSVSGRLEAMADVVTAVEKINKGTTISSRRLKMSRQNLVHLQNPFFNSEELIGMRAKRTIHSGRVLDKRDIETLPIINKGELVKIFANKGSMFLSTSGIAKMDGRLGDIIQIENINSKKLIYCRVNSPGVVTVEF